MENKEKFPVIDLGVSRCLMGDKVRYDGGHKLDRFLTQTVGPLVRFHAVCPEVECGLPVPRESMRLEGDPDAPRLMTHKSRQDHTERMRTWATGRLDELAELPLCGYIFKSKSPSSGMERVKIYDAEGTPRALGRGIFAGMFMDRFPLLPVEDEGRLHDPGLRENFFVRVFAWRRWLDLVNRPPHLGSLVSFHTKHKLLLLAHHPESYKELGRLVAQGAQLPLAELYQTYIQGFMHALGHLATINTHVNVLMHGLGYFKQQLSADEKLEMLQIIEEYHKGQAPLLAPLTLLSHWVRKYDQAYLAEQIYLKPHPVELKLRGCP